MTLDISSLEQLNNNNPQQIDSAPVSTAKKLAIPVNIDAILKKYNLTLEKWQALSAEKQKEFIDTYKNNTSIANIPSNIKAIPIAVMIVLCPITITSAGEIVNQVEVAQEKTAYELFGLRCIENAVLDKSMIPERYKAYFDKTRYKDYKYGLDKSDKDYTCITKWIGIRAFNDNQKMFITASTVESDWHHVDDIPDRQTLLRSYNLEINN